MTTIVKIHRKGQMTLPSRLRQMAGIAEGDLVSAVFLGGKIIITPTLVIDRSGFPNADDEYTPKQRRDIDESLAVAERGPFYGPFNTADEMIADLKGKLKRRVTGKKIKKASK